MYGCYSMHRVEVCLKSHLPDARGLGLVRDICDLGITTVSNVQVADIYWLDADLSPDELNLICRSLLADPVTQEYQYFTPATDVVEGDKGGEVDKQSHTIEVAYNAGVTDPVEETIMKALQDLGMGGVRVVKTVRRYLLQGRPDEYQLQVICDRLLVNPIIQHVVEPEHFGFPENPQYRFRLNQVDILELDNAGFSQVRQRFGFTDDELQAIIAYFHQQGRNPTDAELETLAQTWSEHCVHKTFKGKIRFGTTTIDNLLKANIMKATE